MVALTIKSQTTKLISISGESESKLGMEILPLQSGVEQQLVLQRCDKTKPKRGIERLFCISLCFCGNFKQRCFKMAGKKFVTTVSMKKR